MFLLNFNEIPVTYLHTKNEIHFQFYERVILKSKNEYKCINRDPIKYLKGFTHSYPYIDYISSEYWKLLFFM